MGERLLFVVGLMALLVGMVLLALTPARAFGASEPLIFGGTGSSLSVTRLLVDEFRRGRPEVRITVPPSLGSGGAVHAVADGAIPLGMIARPLTPQEAARGVRAIPFARTALVIAANPGVSDDELTSADLVGIYRGTRKTWRDGREIIVLTRQRPDVVISELERKIPGFAAAYADSERARRWLTIFSDQEMDAAVARTPLALGFSDLGTLTIERLAVKPLRLDGIAPTVENLASGRYPLQFTLAFVVKPEALTGDVRAFVEFVGSPAGQRLLRANGLVPVR